MKGRLTAALAAGALLAGAGTAVAAFVTEAGSPYPVGTQPYSIYAADFNGDGRTDVATTNGSSGDVSVYLRNAGAGFTQEPGSPFAGSAGNGGAAVADFDGNGLPDLVTTGFGDNSLSILSAQPGGGFTQQKLTMGGSPQAATAGDFNGDGRPDFVVSLYGSNTVAVEINARGTFTTQASVPGGGQPSVQAVADFDSNSLLDFAFINTSGDSVTVVRQTAAGVFTTEETIPLGVQPGGIATGDFNGDQRPDLAVTRYGDSTVEILLRNAANDGFTEQPGSPYAVSTSPQGVAVGDFDLDGRQDLAVAANSGAIDILHNTGSGFSDAVIPMPGQTEVGIAVADFNGDGRPDGVTSDTANNTFSAILNPVPIAPAPTPTPAPTATPVPAPVAGSTVNVARRSGTVTIKLKGSSKYVPVTTLKSIPVGSTIDTRKGRVTITAAQAKGKTASADFFDGLFKITQTKGAKPVTTLTLTEALSCSKSGAKASAAAKKKKTRKLWGDGSGAFSTRGQYSAATVRGTRWLVTDTCTTTVTKVAKGVVSVRDLVKKKTVVVRAPHSYTARRKH